MDVHCVAWHEDDVLDRSVLAQRSDQFCGWSSMPAVHVAHKLDTLQVFGGGSGLSRVNVNEREKFDAIVDFDDCGLAYTVPVRHCDDACVADEKPSLVEVEVRVDAWMTIEVCGAVPALLSVTERARRWSATTYGTVRGSPQRLTKTALGARAGQNVPNGPGIVDSGEVILEPLVYVSC